MKTKLLSLMIVFVIGCASIPTVVSGLQLASTVLPIVDSFYDSVLEAKQSPNKLQTATLILQQADQVAKQVQLLQSAPKTEQVALVSQATLLQKQANEL